MDDLISPSDVRRQQEAGRPLAIIDVRSADDFAAGHLPGARNIPIDELEGRLGELSTDQTVVTYCMMRHRGSARCERAAALLRERGYQAQALDGGLPGWQAAGGVVEARV